MVTLSKKNARPLIDGNVVHNKILQSLPAAGYERISEDLTFVELGLNDVLQEAGAPVKFCYFINSGMVSFLSFTKTGTGVEVGLGGKEGFVGSTVAAGFRSSGNRAVVQGGGTAFRLGRRDLLDAISRTPELTVSLFRHLLKASFQTSQIAACNQLHQIEPRLIRWLLMSQDCMGTFPLELTHEFLAQMLVVNRSTVSIAAGNLQKAGLIGYRRGKITIPDRARLEEATCECYALMNEQIGRWDVESSALTPFADLKGERCPPESR